MQAVVSETMVTLPGGAGIQTAQPVTSNQPSKNKSGTFESTLKAKTVNSKQTAETTEPTATDTDSSNVDAALAFGISALPGGGLLNPVTSAETDQLAAGLIKITELPDGDNQQTITAVAPESSKIDLPFADVLANQKTDSAPVIAAPSQAADDQLVAANLNVSNPVLEVLVPGVGLDSNPAMESIIVTAMEMNQPPNPSQLVTTATIDGEKSQGNKQVVYTDQKLTSDNTVAVAVSPEVFPNAEVPNNNFKTEPVAPGTTQVVDQDMSAMQLPAAQVDAQIIPQAVVLAAVVKQDKTLTQNSSNGGELPASNQTTQNPKMVDNQAATKAQTISSQETIPSILPTENADTLKTNLAANDNGSGQSTMPTAELNDSDDQLAMGEGSEITVDSGSKTDAASDYALLFKLQQTAQNRILKKEAANPQENIKNVVQRLEFMLNDNVAQAKMVLKPEHLGQLTIHMNVQDGVLNAKFVVDNQQAKAMLETNLTVFRQQLEQSGVRVEKVEVTINQPGNDSSQFFNQSQYRPPGQGSYQQSGINYYSRQDSYGSGDYDYPPETVPLIAANSNSVGADGVNYVV